MLMRFDPFRDLDRIAQDLPGAAGRGFRTFPMDAYRQGDGVVLLFDLPGVDPTSIDLTVDQNVLTIRAERHANLDEDMEVIAAERPQGTFVRSVFLGDALDTDRISAQHQNGVLQLTIPVSERAKPRKIEVTGNGRQPAEPVTAGA